MSKKRKKEKIIQSITSCCSITFTVTLYTLNNTTFYLSIINQSIHTVVEKPYGLSIFLGFTMDCFHNPSHIPAINLPHFQETHQISSSTPPTWPKIMVINLNHHQPLQLLTPSKSLPDLRPPHALQPRHAARDRGLIPGSRGRDPQDQRPRAVRAGHASRRAQDASPDRHTVVLG